MKEKLKKIVFGYLPGFITGLVVCGGISVLAMTYFPSKDVSYENSTSGLKSTNVQGAIDELYNICFPPTAGGSILDKEPIVTSGDGLYEDEYEDGKYTYKGANPNNYVTFNDEKAGWRIISINSDGSIKIMKDGSIGKRAWDSSNSNNWNRPATLNTYLNGTYYNSLTSVAQSQIVSSNYGIGAVTWNNNDLADQINDENGTTWNGKVALPTVSEYIRTNSNANCKTWSANNSNVNTCKNSTWMFSLIYNWWTLSPEPSNSSGVSCVATSGGVGSDAFSGSAQYTSNSVRPVITLSSEVKITGGDGSESNPYTLG